MLYKFADYFTYEINTRPTCVIFTTSLGSVLVLLVLNSMFRLGLVDTLVTHANKEGFGLTPLSGDCGGYMPPLLKTKQKQLLIAVLPSWIND